MLSSLQWGADQEISLLFYRACIRSVFDYGCMAYGGASDTMLKKLDVAHYKCLRLCTGLMKDTPINALLSEAGEYPLIAICPPKNGGSFYAILFVDIPRFSAQLLNSALVDRHL